MIDGNRVNIIIIILTVVSATNLAFDIFDVKYSITDLINSTKSDSRQIMDILQFRYKVDTQSRTDYAWHFNEGQKLDRLIDDIDEIKNELGLVENYTYAGHK